MKLRPLPRRASSEENLLPLINIVFLLLIFFMLVGRLTPPDSLAVEPPRSHSEQIAKPEPLRLLLAADGRLALGERVFTLDRLAAELGPALAGTPQPALWLKADAGLPAARLLDVLEALRTLGVEQLILLSAAGG